MDNGEEEQVKWIGGVGKRVGPLVSEFCFDILKRVGIEYKTNNLFLAQWSKHSDISARSWVRAPACAYFLATRIFLVAWVQ